ncbi:MAG TPA: hypothetical protein V6C65_40640, partial [Allocoleopsis sp.]
VLGFICDSEQFLHWFIIPVTLSGVLMGTDVVDWFQGRLNLFDPIAILGLLGVHFFFLAPLLHIAWDSWMDVTAVPGDWRTWLGAMAALNLLGLLIYRLVRDLGSVPENSPTNRSIWRLNWRRFPMLLGFALALSAVLQIQVYQHFGGILGYITTATDPTIAVEAGRGMGPLFMISESFPMLAMIGFVAYARRHKTWRTWTVLSVVMLIFLVLLLFFGGLKGSRSTTIWALFWAIGMIHFWVRPISKKIIALGLIFLVGFMYMYGFYKSGGLEGFRSALESSQERIALEERSGRTWDVLLLQDLGRSDLQAYILYRLMQSENDYDYGFGRTYYAALSIMIPPSLWPDKPLPKTKEGTEVLYGPGSYVPGIWTSSKVYGLAGEAMLNFGPLAVPLAFVVLGLLVGRVRHYLLTLDPSDVRLLLLPLMINFCFVVLASDLDNDIFFLFSKGFAPFLLLLFSSQIYDVKNTPSLQSNPLKF